MIPIVLCIDVEPDIRMPEPGTEVRWDGWDWIHARIGPLRRRLAALTGRPAHFNWFLRIDPQIERLHGDVAFSAKRDRTRLLALRAEGDDIGLHPHLARRDAEDRHWIVDFADRAWICGVLATAVSQFRACLGFAPESVRMGDSLIGEATVGVLPSLGIRYDLSAEPGCRPEAWEAMLPQGRGPFPGTLGVPRRPYRPSRRDFRRPGRLLPRRLWIVPISMTPLPGGRPIDVTALNLVLPWGPAVYDALIAEPETPCIVAVMRSGDFSLPHWRENLTANLETLLAHPRAADFAFTTPAELVAWHRGRNANRGGAGAGSGARTRPV